MVDTKLLCEARVPRGQGVQNENQSGCGEGEIRSV
jgi:hypothetical protein